MTSAEPFASRLHRFYESCDRDEQLLLGAMCARFLTVQGAEVEAFGDLGQTLQFQLQQAMTSYSQAIQTQSNASKKHHDALRSIIQRLR